MRTGEEIRVSREDALRGGVTLKKPTSVMSFSHKLVFQTAAGRRAFRMDDVGYLAVEHWLTGRAAPRTCRLAIHALTLAILGFFCFQIALPTLALIMAYRARKIIKQCPQFVTGGGRATAATVIAIVALAFGVPLAFLLVLDRLLP